MFISHLVSSNLVAAISFNFAAFSIVLILNEPSFLSLSFFRIFRSSMLFWVVLRSTCVAFMTSNHGRVGCQPYVDRAELQRRGSFLYLKLSICDLFLGASFVIGAPRHYNRYNIATPEISYLTQRCTARIVFLIFQNWPERTTIQFISHTIYCSDFFSGIMSLVKKLRAHYYFCTLN